MRIAREHPKLEPEQAQRVAHLSMRHALKGVAQDAQAASRQPPEIVEAALSNEDRLANRPVATAIAAEERIRHVASSFTIPEDIRPADQGNRATRIERNGDEHQWRVTFGPNRAGVDLPKNIDALACRSDCADAPTFA